MSTASRNWFDHGGDAYARFRPLYPAELARSLAALAPARGLAVDVGCGTGQLTSQLAEHFDRVVGVDPSKDQLASAVPHARVSYVCASASELPIADARAALVTAAQAAHWFDLSAFYAEVRRIAAPRALVSLIAYGAPRLPGELDDLFQRFYADDIGPYWPAERRLVDRGYRDLPFPFEAVDLAPLTIDVAWPLSSFLGYVGTWSAVRRAREAGRDDLLLAFAATLGAAWGDPDRPRPVTWPIHVRAGRFGGEPSAHG